jgi:AcrR family transcriptional regulator
MEHIAADAGVSKPAIYYHFRDKKALYEELLCPRFEKLREEIETATHGEEPLRGIEKYIDSFGGFLLDEIHFSSLFARELTGGGATMPQSCLEIIGAMVGGLDKLPKEGEKRAIFRKENPFMIQMLIVSPLLTYMTTGPIRERIAMELERKNSEEIEAEMSNILSDLKDKIIRGLKC